MDKSGIKALFARYKKGACTAEEIQLLHKWLAEGNFDASERSDEDMLGDLQQLETSLPLKQPRKIYPLRRIAGYAASLVFLIGLGYFTYREFVPTPDVTIASSDLMPLEPGSNKALLKLNDGTTLQLDTMSWGKVLDVDGAKIHLNNEGQLVYMPEENLGVIKNHQIITPNGGQYEVILPDGTHIWLNSSSTLSFTNTFKELTERRVELTGEAYFKVSRDTEHPFVVTSLGQEIKVLGTEFNVNAYLENNYIKASLVEGSILFNQDHLSPGQSATHKNNHTTIYHDNIDDIIAWKNGYFVFFEESLEEAMKKVSRWYDLDVSFADEDTKSILFGGSISRYEYASKVFRMIEKAGNVKITVNDRKVTVTKIENQ